MRAFIGCFVTFGRHCCGGNLSSNDRHCSDANCLGLQPKDPPLPMQCAGHSEDDGSQSLSSVPSESSALKDLQLKLKVPFADLTFHALIGKGSFKQVYRGKWNNTNVAIVAMRRGGLVTEARLMQQLGAHPNLVQFYRWSSDHRGNEYVVAELVPFGGLDRVLAQFGPALRNRSKLAMCEQVAHAMCELAAEGVRHRDLAARNILVQSLQPVHVKVSDFGLARVAPHWGAEQPLSGAAEGGGGGCVEGAGSGAGASLGPAAGGGARSSISGPLLEGGGGGEEAAALVPVRWSAPEVLRSGGGGWSEKSDVYSYGVTMWEIFSDGAEPYANRSNLEAADAILGCQLLPRPKTCPYQVYALMLDCWHADPAQRPTFRQIADVYRRWREAALAAKAAGSVASSSSLEGGGSSLAGSSVTGGRGSLPGRTGSVASRTGSVASGGRSSVAGREGHVPGSGRPGGMVSGVVGGSGCGREGGGREGGGGRVSGAGSDGRLTKGARGSAARRNSSKANKEGNVAGAAGALQTGSAAAAAPPAAAASARHGVSDLQGLGHGSGPAPEVRRAGCADGKAAGVEKGGGSGAGSSRCAAGASTGGGGSSGYVTVASLLRDKPDGGVAGGGGPCSGDSGGGGGGGCYGYDSSALLEAIPSGKILHLQELQSQQQQQQPLLPPLRRPEQPPQQRRGRAVVAVVCSPQEATPKNHRFDRPSDSWLVCVDDQHQDVSPAVPPDQAEEAPASAPATAAAAASGTAGRDAAASAGPVAAAAAAAGAAAGAGSRMLMGWEAADSGSGRAANNRCGHASAGSGGVPPLAGSSRSGLADPPGRCVRSVMRWGDGNGGGGGGGSSGAFGVFSSGPGGATQLASMTANICETCMLSMEVETAIDPMISASTALSTAVNCLSPRPFDGTVGVQTPANAAAAGAAMGFIMDGSGTCSGAGAGLQFYPVFSQAAAAGGSGGGRRLHQQLFGRPQQQQQQRPQQLSKQMHQQQLMHTQLSLPDSGERALASLQDMMFIRAPLPLPPEPKSGPTPEGASVQGVEATAQLPPPPSAPRLPQEAGQPPAAFAAPVAAGLLAGLGAAQQQPVPQQAFAGAAPKAGIGLAADSPYLSIRML